MRECDDQAPGNPPPDDRAESRLYVISGLRLSRQYKARKNLTIT